MAFLIQLGNNLSNGAWYADEVLSWLVFTALVSLAVGWWQDRREAKRNEPFSNWKLKIIGRDEPQQDLYPDEVKRFLQSEFEHWKFVKSVLSSHYDVKLMTGAKAFASWVSYDKALRLFVIDLTKAPAEHIEVRPGRSNAGPRT